MADAEKPPADAANDADSIDAAVTCTPWDPIARHVTPCNFFPAKPATMPV